MEVRLGKQEKYNKSRGNNFSPVLKVGERTTHATEPKLTVEWLNDGSCKSQRQTLLKNAASKIMSCFFISNVNLSLTTRIDYYKNWFNKNQVTTLFG